MACSVNLTRIDTLINQTSRNPIAMSTRSKTSKFIAKKEAIIPAKRISRAKSTPAKVIETMKPSYSNQTKRRRLSETSPDGNSSKKKKIENDDMAQVIQLNCKLTNEILKLKNSVMEKTNDFIKLQEKYHQKTLECISLQSSLNEAKKEIDILNEACNTLKGQQFCSDLIKFDDDCNDNQQMRYGMFALINFQQKTAI